MQSSGSCYYYSDYCSGKLITGRAKALPFSVWRDIMKIQQCLTTKNSYDTNKPEAIVFHNTDNFARTATARSHAEGLRDGHMKGMSWHVVVDDKEAFQCLPFNRGAWHVGVNYGGKLFGKINNRNSICVEMCVNEGYDYEKAFRNSVDVVKQLMKQLNIPAERVYSHFDICGKNCPSQVRAHGDWERFKQLIGSAETDFNVAGEAVVDKIYRVRKTWEDASSQTNAFYILENAKADADKHPGYSVFDENGVAVYTSKDPQEVYTPAEWIAMIAPIAQDIQREYGILAEVLIAQTALETGWGSTDLARRYNILGMKADLINGTWSQWSTWSGETYTKETWEHENGQDVKKPAAFRVYHSFRECMEDYANFLLHVRNNKGLKYARIQGWTDPLAVISAIRIGTGTDAKPEGYFTDPNYVDKIMKLIVDYDLSKYSAAVAQQDDGNAAQPQQKGTGMVKKFIAAMKSLNTKVKKDIKAALLWYYYNTKRSENTFEKTRKAGKRWTNCMGGLIFALKEAGVPAEALDWYGGKGKIVWLNDKAEANAKKYFDFIPIKTRTVKQCMEDGTLQHGDIKTYMDMVHTNAYYADNKSYDTGHAFCEGSGEGALFKKWIGTTPYKNHKLNFIVRLKDGGSAPEAQKQLYYRVQINAFNSEANANKCKAQCKELTKPLTKDGKGLDAFCEKMSDGKWHVFCGSFKDNNEAEKRKALLDKPGLYPGTFIKAVYI